MLPSASGFAPRIGIFVNQYISTSKLHKGAVIQSGKYMYSTIADSSDEWHVMSSQLLDALQDG